jgi:hypothetical protein
MFRLKFLLLLSVCLASLIISEAKVVNSVTSDDDCEAFEIDQTLATNISSYKQQKSLLIVFDGTSSMNDDLVQMREAVKKIVNKFSEKKNNPIKNYVLTVFKDPSTCE